MVESRRNALCACGSKLRYKSCHGKLVAKRPTQADALLVATASISPPDVELRREALQGQGRPIISAEMDGNRMITVGERTIVSNAKTFPDFLLAYLRVQMGEGWVDSGLSMPESERHPVVKWLSRVSTLQRSLLRRPGEHFSVPHTGAVYATLLLAYDLYSIEHNGEFSRKLVTRLKRAKGLEFQEVLTEIRMAGVLTRAGFSLKFEDESDPGSKHPEYIATRRASGTGFRVECKTHRWDEPLRNDANGRLKIRKKIGAHLSKALGKGFPLGTVYIIELAVPEEASETTLLGAGWWHQAAYEEIIGLENEFLDKGRDTPPSYVIVCNTPYHLLPDSTALVASWIMDGFGTKDFRYGTCTTIDEARRLNRAHGDFIALLASMSRHQGVPQTFDGRDAFIAFGDGSQRFQIGKRYPLAEFINGKCIEGTLEHAWINNEKRSVEAIFRIDCQEQLHLNIKMTDAEYDAYLAHPDTFFGVREFDDLGALFQHLMDCSRTIPRAELIKLLEPDSVLEILDSLSREELAEELCARTIAKLKRVRPV